MPTGLVALVSRLKTIYKVCAGVLGALALVVTIAHWRWAWLVLAVILIVVGLMLGSVAINWAAGTPLAARCIVVCCAQLVIFGAAWLLNSHVQARQKTAISAAAACPRIVPASAAEHAPSVLTDGLDCGLAQTAPPALPPVRPPAPERDAHLKINVRLSKPGSAVVEVNVGPVEPAKAPVARVAERKLQPTERLAPRSDHTKPPVPARMTPPSAPPQPDTGGTSAAPPSGDPVTGGTPDPEAMSAGESIESPSPVVATVGP
ncbi:MAG TPA: hypothetical protein VGH09_05340 [Solirubrobacteraceae bacterium]|jgi:hypothetical protein